MKPVAIFRHATTEGPGYLASFLDARQIPWKLIRIDAGDAIPESHAEFSGLVFMGGPMSVNDDLPWIPKVLSLIQGAVAAKVPVLGHCLGGQLMSKALGGVVSGNPVKEIGWGRLNVSQTPAAKQLFPGLDYFEGFHWHGETFTLPQGSTPVLSSQYCGNQAFVLGKHIGFQCHIEMTSDMVHEWCRNGAAEIQQAADSPGVQQVPEILKNLELRITELNKVADKVYSVWITGLIP
jgi:GMP synthase-like glutamine amidotransferase